jgi:hypothetical protein
MKTPGFPLAKIATIQTAGFDKAEFAYAVRLLHVVWAWSGQVGPSADNPAKKDPLYPQNLAYSKWPLYDAIAEFLNHHNYVAPKVTASDARVQHKVTCKMFPDPFDERDPVGPCTCDADK